MDWFPLYLSIKVAVSATLVTLVLGLPLAWLLARGDFPGRELLDAVATMPLVLPPSVLGYYLLVVLGREGLIGRFLEETMGISLVFTWQGAVIAASIVALPLLVKTAVESLESVDPELESAARTLGRSDIAVLFTITIPLAWRGIVAGVVLAFARALGDFGATLLVAGNIPGKTQTMAVAIYDAIQAGNSELANFLVLVMTVFAFGTLLILNRLNRVVRRR
ncbi:MAG: molybdate ABC transporter permease subunit [Clostridia bacterium]|nr:molybdate ABC transporter permease subunit [Clostridia bacterium]